MDANTQLILIGKSLSNLADILDGANDMRWIRAHVILEELGELTTSMGMKSEVDVFDGLVDVAYGLSATAAVFQFDFVGYTTWTAQAVDFLDYIRCAPSTFHHYRDKSATLRSSAQQLADTAYTFAMWSDEDERFAQLRPLFDAVAMVVFDLGTPGPSPQLGKALIGALEACSALATVLDLPLTEGFKEVHRSNMTKTPPTGDLYAHDKGADYSPPKLQGVLDAWRNRVS